MVFTNTYQKQTMFLEYCFSYSVVTIYDHTIIINLMQ